MVNNEKERKELMEAIRFVLLSTEEFKASLSPLVRDQKDVFKILKSHEEAINNLMDKLIGSKEEHEERLKTLELAKTSVSELKEEKEVHESLHDLLEKRLKRIEFKPISGIVKKIGRNKVVVSDLEVVESVLSLHPDDLYLFGVKSRVLAELDRKQESVKLMEETISNNPKNSWLWYTKGLILEEFDEKMRCFAKSLELLGDDQHIAQHQVLFSRAHLFAINERFEEALQSSTRSVEANPHCENGWCQKGAILAELGRIPEALGCFDKAIELNKNYKEALFLKGNALSALGSDYTDEAISCYDKAIKLDPKMARAYFNKGKLLSEKKHYEEALKAYDKGLKINIKDPCAWCRRGVVLNRMDQNKEALESFKTALELGIPEQCHLIFIDLAIVYHALELSTEFIETFDDIVKDPACVKELEKVSQNFRATLFNNYAWQLYSNTKRYQEGVKFAKKAIETKPESARCWDTLACNIQALGKDVEALEAFEKALSLKKTDKEISWNDLAKLYRRMGRTEEAEQAYQKFKSTENEAKHTKDEHDD